MLRSSSLLLLAGLPLLCLFPALSVAAPVDTGERAVPHVGYPGLKTLTFRYGPLSIRPGQNSIEWSGPQGGPSTPGFITRFEPNLVYAASGVPVPSTELHLHHAQWKMNDQPVFPAGGEKTIFQYPRGFGLPVSGSESWRLNYMIHNLTSAPRRAYLTWQVDFVPRAQDLKPLSVKWMDVVGSGLYPVFDALRSKAPRGRYLFPDQAPAAERSRSRPLLRWRAPRPLTLVHTAAHLHPGALYSNLFVSRAGRRELLFRSQAKYFGSGDPVSWDMAITATPAAWRVKLRRGDLLSTNTMVDTSASSWRESMSILPLAVYEGSDAGGVDPFAAGASWPTRGRVTHGPLAGGNFYGGRPTGLPDPRSLPDGPRADSVAIRGFRYRLGDLAASGPAARPPLVSPGDSLTFVNLDSARVDSSPVYHTVTACRAPCNASTGTAYPREDGFSDFDSGQLGFSLADLPPAKGSNRWSTPRDLSPGTYTFFCRVHPSMRGAFRVKPSSSPYSLSAGWLSLPSGGNGV